MRYEWTEHHPVFKSLIPISLVMRTSKSRRENDLGIEEGFVPEREGGEGEGEEREERMRGREREREYECLAILP